MMDVLTSMNGSHGITVTLMNSPTKASEMMDAALVIVGPNSSMFGANHPDPGLKTLPIPSSSARTGTRRRSASARSSTRPNTRPGCR
jgi:hypothetical protein